MTNKGYIKERAKRTYGVERALLRDHEWKREVDVRIHFIRRSVVREIKFNYTTS